MRYSKKYICLVVLIGAFTVSGCGGEAKNIVQSDIDIAASTVIDMLNDYIRRLALELYRTNPEELARNPSIRLDQRLNQIVDYPTAAAYSEIDNKQRSEAMQLALDEAYKGDRVFALMIGIAGMIKHSYNNQLEFFFFDTLDPQSLYNSSYNLQALKQKLAYAQPQLLHIETDYGKSNNAYTLIEKISTTQNLMAHIIADKTSRALNKTLLGTAAVFIPII